MDGHWAAAAAGHVEQGETAYDAARREAAEEIDVTDLALEFVTSMQRTQSGEPIDERIDFFFTARSWAGEPRIVEPEKCADLRWCAARRPPGSGGAARAAGVGRAAAGYHRPVHDVRIRATGGADDGARTWGPGPNRRSSRVSRIPEARTRSRRTTAARRTRPEPRRQPGRRRHRAGRDQGARRHRHRGHDRRRVGADEGISLPDRGYRPLMGTRRRASPRVQPERQRTRPRGRRRWA